MEPETEQMLQRRLRQEQYEYTWRFFGSCVALAFVILAVVGVHSCTTALLGG
ncbi:MAG: hypothetical protein NW206_19865 [Hyphomonadaceae bacterium]|nr:hypothetical protein [Hyphomonadaceae bacterium]